MATYYLQGTCKWAKLQEPGTNYDKTSRSYSIDMFLDENSWKLFEESGCQLKRRTDKETGETFVSFKRAEKKIIKGTIKEMGPPEVLDGEGNPFTGKVGNGSTVIVKISVYPSLKGMGHTLEAIKLVDLIEYEGEQVKTANADVVPF